MIMTKILYYRQNGGALKRCIITNKSSNYNLPIVAIKGEQMGAGDLILNGIVLYTYDQEAIAWGMIQRYDIQLLSNPIRSAREAKGLTQARLAELVGVSPQHIQAWEYGTRKPNAKNLLQLAEILEVDPKNLI